MPLDISHIITAGATTLATKGVEELIKNHSNILDSMTGHYKVLNQEMVVYCPENIQKNSIIFEARGGILPRKIKFPYGKPRRIKIKPIIGNVDLSDAVNVSDIGFELDTKLISKTDTFILDFEYKLKNLYFLDALVERNRAREIPKDAESEYWIQAGLKHPNVLKTKYGKLELQDIDFNVDVGISEDIKTVIPSPFEKELEAAVKLIHERDAHKKWKLGYAHSQAMQSRGKYDDVLQSLAHLQELFFPQKFARFVDVKDDFHYSNCHQGNNYHDQIPFPTWPKTMTVTSRTDLNLDKCAADGKLVYKKRDFLDQVGKILGA